MAQAGQSCHLSLTTSAEVSRNLKFLHLSSTTPKNNVGIIVLDQITEDSDSNLHSVMKAHRVNVIQTHSLNYCTHGDAKMVDEE